MRFRHRKTRPFSLRAEINGTCRAPGYGSHEEAERTEILVQNQVSRRKRGGRETPTKRLGKSGIALVDNYPVKGTQKKGENETILIENRISSNEKNG